MVEHALVDLAMKHRFAIVPFLLKENIAIFLVSTITDTNFFKIM